VSLSTVSCCSRHSCCALPVWIQRFYHLRQLQPLCRSLKPAEATTTLVQAFISCRLDYCNSLLYRVTDKLCGKYSRYRMLREGWSQELNVAPTSHRYCVKQFHWLRVTADDECVEFKIASLVYQVMSSKVPSYLADDIHLASESSAHSLGSILGRKCSVARVRSRFGDRCFATAGPHIWNNLLAMQWRRHTRCVGGVRSLLRTLPVIFQWFLNLQWLSMTYIHKKIPINTDEVISHFALRCWLKFVVRWTHVSVTAVYQCVTACYEFYDLGFQ